MMMVKRNDAELDHDCRSYIAVQCGVVKAARGFTDGCWAGRCSRRLRGDSGPFANCKASVLKLLSVLAALAGAPLLAQAQGALPIPGYAATASPWGFSIKRVNNLDTAPISFEGQHLFVVAAPAAPADAAIPAIVQRVNTITDNLQRIVPPAVGLGNRPASHFDPKTFKVSIGSENGYPTLYATDASKREVAPIVTLTEADATLNSMSRNDLAVQWQGVLQAALGRALMTAEPEYFAAQLRKLPFVLAGAVLVTMLLIVLRRRLRRRNDVLDAASDSVDPYETSDSAGAKNLRVERSIVSGGLRLSSVAILAMWAVVILWVLGILPSTHALANVLTTRSIRVVVLWLILALLDRLLNVAIVRVADNWESSLFATPGDRARLTLRRPTVVRAVENLKSIVLWAIAILATLSVLSVSATSVLTIGAVIAFALSFATQNPDRREPGGADPAGNRAGAVGRRDRDRFGYGGDPGPAARFRRAPAPVARAPDRARRDLLPGRHHGDGRPRAWHTARHSQITAALRARGLAPATPGA